MMSMRNEQCRKVCRILDDVLANRPTERDALIVAVKTAFDELKERKTGRWIPCSERLPEEAYPVVVTWKNDDPVSYYQYILGKHYTGVAHFKDGKWFWYSSVTEDVLMEYGRCDSEEFDEAIQVLAWMPLPEPYGEGEHEK